MKARNVIYGIKFLNGNFVEDIIPHYRSERLIQAIYGYICEMEEIKNTHGGKREGAGQPKKYDDRVQIVFYIEKEKRKRLREVKDLKEKFDKWVDKLLAGK